MTDPHLQSEAAAAEAIGVAAPSAPPSAVPGAGPPSPPPAGAAVGGSARFARAPLFLAAVIGLALYLAGMAYDLLQHRLHDSTERFDATVRRFERYWTLYDASVESTLALKFDLGEGGPGASAPAATPPAPASMPATDVRRFALQAAALRGEVAQPGVLMLSQAAGWDAAVRGLEPLLARLAEGDTGPALAGDVRDRIRQVLDGLARMGREARERQSLAAGFRDEVDAVRRQVLLAFAGLVAVLVLFVAVALQWTVVARREAGFRRQAERLAAIAEAERGRAEQVARDKARFLGMLSHELLTPLQSIWSTMDVIESRGRIEASDPAFQRLKEGTRALRSRISDLVDFARMSSGKLETRIRPFHLDKLIDTALRDLEEPLAARNLDVHWEAPPELAQRIRADPARLRQVIDNLLSNAIKYTERGGLTIHATLHDGRRRLRLEVSDTGAGIPAEALPRVFEPFYRAPGTAAMAEGSGLGLAVVRSLVDLMGGTIEVHSRIGQGSAFIVELPLAPPPDDALDEPPAPIPASEPPPERLPVLVIDDSPDARRAIAQLVRELGHVTYEASSGAMGLAEAGARPHLAIVVDLQMPDIDGQQVAIRLRQPGGMPQAAFLILASAWNDLSAATARPLFDACLDKPVDRAALEVVLTQAQAQAPPG